MILKESKRNKEINSKERGRDNNEEEEITNKQKLKKYLKID